MRVEHLWKRTSMRESIKIDGVRALYLNNLLRSMAGSMVGVFFPAYVYLWGYNIGGFGYGIKVLILSMVIERTIVFLMGMPLGKIVLRLGFKKSILISSFILASWFLLPVIFERSLALISVLSVISGIAIPIYWLARMSIFSIDGGNNNDFGKEVSIISLTDQVASILAPFVGGVLLVFGGFGLLFGTATLICILAAIPIFFIGDYKIVDGISLKRFVQSVKSKQELHLHLGFIGQGVANMVDAYFWPLYIFIFVGSFAVLGTITSITFALSSVAIYFAGKIFDRRRAMGGMEDEKEFTVATIVLAFLTMLRPITRSLLGIFSLDASYKMAYPFWSVDEDSYLFSAGKRAKSPLEFYTYRELVYSAARVVSPLLLLFFLGSGYFWWITFGLGSLGTLLTLGMQKES